METVFFAHCANTGFCRFQVVFFALARADHNILGSGKDVYQLKVLMDHTDIVTKGILRGANARLFSANQNRSFIRIIDACQHIHQGRFSATVLTENGKDLSLFDVYGNVVICNDARTKPFGNAAQLDYRLLFHDNSPCRLGYKGTVWHKGLPQRNDNPYACRSLTQGAKRINY